MLESSVSHSLPLCDTTADSTRHTVEEIDSNPEIGNKVDCTSNYENEADDMAKANPPVDLTPELWIVKMLLGGIDDSCTFSKTQFRDEADFVCA